MSRIKAGLELAEEINQEEQLAEIQEEPTEETVEEFQEESIEETIASIEESFDQALNEFNLDQIVTENLDSRISKCASLASKYFNSAGLQKEYDIAEYIKSNAGSNSIVNKCASLASKYFNSAGLQKEYDIAEYIKANTKKSVTEGIWGDFKRDFLGSKPRGGSAGDHFKRLAQSYAKKSAEAKDMHDMETALQYRDLSWYYSLMSGNPPQNIKDPDQFKYDVEHNPALKMHIDRELKNARVNELKEPKDNDESDNDTYLQNLTRKKVRKEYEKSLPKGHTSLAKKYNLEEESKSGESLAQHGWKLTKDHKQAKQYTHPKHPDHVITTFKHGGKKALWYHGSKGINTWPNNDVGMGRGPHNLETYLQDFHSKNKTAGNLEEVENPKDKVTMDIPLLIRLLEYAREDAKTDMDLHDLTEKLVAMGSESGKTLSMSDYDQLVSNQEETYEAKNPAMARTKAIAKMQKNSPSFKKAMEKGEKKDIKEAKGKPIEFLPYVLQNARNTFSDMEAIEDLFDYTYLEDLKFDEIIQGMENERKTAAKYINPRLSWLLQNIHDKAYLNVIKSLAIKWMREMSPLLDDYVGRIIDKSPNY